MLHSALKSFSRILKNRYLDCRSKKLWKKFSMRDFWLLIRGKRRTASVARRAGLPSRPSAAMRREEWASQTLIHLTSGRSDGSEAEKQASCKDLVLPAQERIITLHLFLIFSLSFLHIFKKTRFCGLLRAQNSYTLREYYSFSVSFLQILGLAATGSGAGIAAISFYPENTWGGYQFMIMKSFCPPQQIL